MDTWEYLVVFLADTDFSPDAEIDAHLDADRYTEMLNVYGRAGWELVNFLWTSERGAKAAFKRRVTTS